jgi:branched-chain amino acid transport system permease protein
MTVDTGALPSWPGQYLREHTLHLVVVGLFVIYPFAYDFLTSTFGLPAKMLLPQIRTMLTILWLGLFAMSFDFISGYTGYLSFGHAAFFGIGAYFVVLGYNGQIPVLPAELPFMALMLIGALLAALFAFVVGLVSFRLTGVYFAMITLGVAELLFVMASHWDFLTPGEGDPSDGVAAGSPTEIDIFEPVIGVPFVDPLNAQIGAFGDTALLGVDFGNPQIVSYFMIGAVVLLCYLSMQRILHSPFGRVMIAIRENEQRAKAIGYNTYRYKLGAFMISAFFGGVAGALLVSYVGTVDPDTTLFFLVTGFVLVATIIGGIGTLSGAFFGYVFLESLEEFLARGGSGGGLQPFLENTVPSGVLSFEIGGLQIREGLDAFMTGHGDFYAGIIFVVFVLYVPLGLLGTLRGRLGTNSLAKYTAHRLFGTDDTEPSDSE